MILEIFSGVGKFWAVTNPLDGQLLGYHNQLLSLNPLTNKVLPYFEQMYGLREVFIYPIVNTTHHITAPGSAFPIKISYYNSVVRYGEQEEVNSDKNKHLP